MYDATRIGKNADQIILYLAELMVLEQPGMRCNDENGEVREHVDPFFPSRVRKSFALTRFPLTTSWSSTS
ncbi:MAG: hypothetical protein V8S24_12220 [Gordonibacter pamelaeae]